MLEHTYEFLRLKFHKINVSEEYENNVLFRYLKNISAIYLYVYCIDFFDCVFLHCIHKKKRLIFCRFMVKERTTPTSS